MNKKHLYESIMLSVSVEVKKALNESSLLEGLSDSIKDTWAKVKNSVNSNNDKNLSNESALHTVSYALSAACESFGKIMLALSKNDVENAKRICTEAYKECKTLFNDTAKNGNTITTQYGAQNSNNFGKK